MNSIKADKWFDFFQKCSDSVQVSLSFAGLRNLHAFSFLHSVPFKVSTVKLLVSFFCFSLKGKGHTSTFFSDNEKGGPLLFFSFYVPQLSVPKGKHPSVNKKAKSALASR